MPQLPQDLIRAQKFDCQGQGWVAECQSLLYLQPSAASHHNVAHIDEVKVCDPSGEVIIQGDLCTPFCMAQSLSITNNKAMCSPASLVNVLRTSCNLGFYFFGVPCMLHAYCSPQSRAPHRASTNLQLKVLLPMLLLTLLCTRHIHCCSSCPDDTFGGSLLKHKMKQSHDHEQVPCRFTVVHRWASRTGGLRALLDNFPKVLGTLSAWIDAGQDIHLHSRRLEDYYGQYAMVTKA